MASVGSLTLRVYVTTRQEYEPYWLMLCWLGFGLRLVIFLAFDVLAGSMTTKCEYNGEEGNAEVEVLYLECFASKFTWLLLAILILVDYVNLLFPLYNPTAVQQGQMAWVGQNEDMASRLGYTACKLELALLPSIICAAGPLIIGDYDTSMEVFVFQLGVFVAPVVLALLGYKFEVNPSSLMLMAQGASVAARYVWRSKMHGDLGICEVHGQNETLEQVRDVPSTNLRLVLGEQIRMGTEVEEDQFHILKRVFASRKSIEVPFEAATPIVAPGVVQKGVAIVDHIDGVEQKSSVISTVVTEAEWIKLSAMTFARYDLDMSGTCNTNEELLQMTHNCIFKLGMLDEALNNIASVGDVEAAAATLDLCEYALTEAQFRTWFEEQILRMPGRLQWATAT